MKRSFSNIFSLLPVVVISIGIGTGACKKEENIKTGSVKPEKNIRDFYVNSAAPKIIKLYSDTVYILDQLLSRSAGEQLIIEEGTLIKVGTRDFTNPFNNIPSAGSITIAPGGVLIANGTADKPIVFTSNTFSGDQSVNWGGISIEGRSTDNSKTTAPVLDDFSGSIRYCRIEFASLSLRSVGSGTTIENVMVSYANNGGPAYRIYGGTFNARYLISYACGGPADFYFANGYTGKMQYVLAYRHPFFGQTGSIAVNAVAGVFMENNVSNPANAQPYNLPVISNLTVIGPNDQKGSTSYYGSTTTRASAIVTTKSTAFNIRNSLFLGYPKAAWILDDYNTARAIETSKAVMSYTFFQANDTSRAFYLAPGTYPPNGSPDFKNYMLTQPFNNKLVLSVNDFSFRDPFNYEAPDLFPKDSSSIVMKGANFDNEFANTFFIKGEFLGAFGKDNWLRGWTNFTPLKTNYNFPQ